jgi:hypothetical protein
MARNTQKAAQAAQPAPAKVVSIKDAAVFKRLNEASTALVSTYGVISGIVDDILAGSITGGQVRAWEQSFAKDKDASNRARSVVRQLQNGIRSKTKDRKASEGGKVTFTLNEAGDAYTLSKVGHNRSGSRTAKAKDEAGAVTLSGAVEFLTVYLKDKDRTPAQMAEARELLMPVARLVGIIK